MRKSAYCLSPAPQAVPQADAVEDFFAQPNRLESAIRCYLRKLFSDFAVRDFSIIQRNAVEKYVLFYYIVTFR